MNIRYSSTTSAVMSACARVMLPVTIDLTLALVFSSVVYIAFAVLLGLNLPSGLLGGGF